jgi:hypothetical protein
VARFPVRPSAVSKAVVTQLNSRLHTAQMVAGQEIHQNKDASIRAKHVRRRSIRLMWQPTVTTSIVESQARAKNKATVTAVI